MLGAIIGDIVGSRFEWNNNRSKDFDFLTYKCFPTDDSIMSLAVAQAILVSKPDHSDLSKNAIECMQAVGRNYPNCGYGGSFHGWIFSNNPKPYNSYGNGAAMRVSAAGFAAESLEEAKLLSKLVTEVILITYDRFMMILAQVHIFFAIIAMACKVRISIGFLKNAVAGVLLISQNVSYC